MPSAQQKFWKLAIDSRLLALEECRRLHGDFAQATGAAPDDATALARWLIQEGVLTRYQARILLAGRAGPFRMGDYTILDHYGNDPKKGLYQAVSRTSGERVLLFVVPKTATADPARLIAVARKAQQAIATGNEQMVAKPTWHSQGTLAFAVLAIFSPAPTVAAVPQPVAEPSAESWPPAELPAFHLRAKRRSWLPVLAGWGVAIFLLGGALLAWMWIDPNNPLAAMLKTPEPSPAAAPTNTPAVETPTPQPVEPQISPGDLELALAGVVDTPALELIDDDGQTLWASPTSGRPIGLADLPAGAEAILVLRPAQLLAKAEGAKMFEAIGPAGQSATEAIEAITSCAWKEIDELVIGFYPTDAGPIKTALVVRLASEPKPEAWSGRFKNRVAAEHDGKHYFKSGDWAYYQPEAEAGRLIVITDPAEIEPLLDAGGAHRTKEMERLAADTDADRDFTLLVHPFSIFTAGRAIFAGELARLADPLRQFIGDGVPALSLSGNVGDELFLELRAYGQSDKDPHELAAHYQKELAALPSRFEAYLAGLQPAAYGKAVLIRLPRMFERLAQATRVGVEHHQALLRAYLPAVAGHNLLLGSELALAEVPKVGAPATGTVAKSASGIEAALTKPISISFPKDTLENSMAMVSNEIGVEIVILGPDLQLEGITRNQQFGLDERDQPAREILLKILKRANPDGKLVYVVKPREAGGEPILFITTRAAAAKRGDPLPPEFQKK
jgi:hypothetical protein